MRTLHAPQVVIINRPAQLAMGMMVSFWITAPGALIAALLPGQPLPLIGVAAAGLAALLRALRIRTVLSHDEVIVANYASTKRFAVGQVRAIVPTAQNVPSVGGGACAGFVTYGDDRPAPAEATMSWNWRTGHTSRRSRKIASQLRTWADSHGIPCSVSASDLA